MCSYSHKTPPRLALLALLVLAAIGVAWRLSSIFTPLRPSGANRVALTPGASGASPGIAPVASDTETEAALARREILERFAYAQAWEGAQPPALAAFRDWTVRYRAVALPGARAALEAEGLALARVRRAAMRDLIVADPERALAVTVPAVVRQILPAAILSELETRVAGTGDYALKAMRPIPGAASTLPPLWRTAVVGGVSYVAHPYGRREAQLTKTGASLHGVALDGHLALHASPLRVLEPGEIPAAAAVANCPVSGLEVAPLAPLAGVNLDGIDVVEAKGRVWEFCHGAAMLETFERDLRSEENQPGPLVSPVPPTAASLPTSQSIGSKPVLVIRVDFADVPGDPISGGAAGAQDVMDNRVRPFVEAASYGKTTLITTVTSKVYRMPQNGSVYAAAASGADTLHSDATNAAKADYATGNYERVIVAFGDLSAARFPGSSLDFSGLGEVAGSRIWICASFDMSTISHELGHTFGLEHANLWQVTDGNPLSPQGKTTEYGDPFDVMGDRSGLADSRYHYNHAAKNRLGWLPDGAVTNVTTSGTYRLYRFDSQAAVQNAPLALRVFRDGTHWYWIGYRQNFSANASLATGAFVLWVANSLQQTQLLDLTTPGVSASDAGLAVGAILDDPLYGIKIKPVGTGTDPAAWIDIEVTLTAAATPNVVVPWGRDGFSITSTTNETLVPFGLTDVVALAAGDRQVLALKVDGTVVAWGNNSNGQATLPAGLANVAAVAAGANFSGVLKTDGTVQLWGDNSLGQLNIPSGLTGVRQLALGRAHAVVVKTDGTVVAWGSNSSGQATVPAGLTDVIAVTAGASGSVALKRDGTVVGWGASNYRAVPAGLSGVTAISCSSASGSGAGIHVLALKADGTVVAWGNNVDGETNVPAGLNSVVAIAASGYHSLALKADGTVVGWGASDVGQTTAPAAMPRAFAIAASANGGFALVGSSVLVTAPLASQPTAAGGSTTLGVAAAGASVQWLRNGGSVAGATASTLTLVNVQPADTGLYAAQVTTGSASVSSPAAIVGVTTTNKVIGAGAEIAHGIFVASNGNTFDQVLPSGAAVTVTAEPGKITRTSFIDLTNDIVQVEFSGAGTLSLVLDNSSGPALSANYNQSTVYMKGHAGIVIVGADATTNAAVFSVGRITAVNQALFKSDVTYDGLADLAFVAISSTNGKFGSLRTSNASYYATKGLTGVYAPGVQFQGPVFIGNIDAFDAATPVIVIGSSPDTRITGGDLAQANGKAVQVRGLAQLKFTAGSDSHGNPLSAKTNRAVLQQSGIDVTAQVVVNPSP